MFESAYPGSDWRKLTASVFLDRLNKVHQVSAYLNGTYSDDHSRIADIDRRNREILIKRRFPTYMPEEDNG